MGSFGAIGGRALHVCKHTSLSLLESWGNEQEGHANGRVKVTVVRTIAQCDRSHAHMRRSVRSARGDSESAFPV